MGSSKLLVVEEQVNSRENIDANNSEELEQDSNAVKKQKTS